MRKSFEEKIGQIIEFARKNGNQISYDIAIDIIKDKEEVTSDELLNVIREAELRGIVISQEVDEGYDSAEADPEKFIPAEVNISQKPVNIYNLMERLENDEIDLQPSFQRKGELWSLEQQSRLIESLMLKIPIPAFYFNASNEDNWVVIDGLQRLTAFLNFLVGIPNDNGVREKKVFTGLQYLRDFNGHTFDELPRQYVRRIKETGIVAYNIEKGTPDAIVFNIFQRINTGGVHLTDQEIRQALYQGKSTQLIEKLADSEEFLTATQKAIPTDRALDREYVTRFLAFTELNYASDYGNVDDYLIKAMKKVNDYNDGQLDDIEKHFRVIMKYCAEIFGKYAFRKYNENWRRGPINKAIFEMWCVCFYELDQKELTILAGKRDQFLQKFGELQRKQDFIAALKGGDRYSIVRRIDLAKNMLKELV